MSDAIKQLWIRLPGRWHGFCRTWFEPNKLADESEIGGTIEPLINDHFLKHRYRGSINGKARSGEELLAYNEITNQWQCSWLDSFHMSKALMFSQGQPTERGFEVFGQYDVGQGQPAWGWRTRVELVDDNQLLLTAFNVTPEGEEAKALETHYQRVSPPPSFC
ncbi:DUF1579 family protein [Roseiconus lacunae]|uniref:DUF1579 family protein n=1 Tax=Roseiconus lacunae TaxID=2605694 RepID=UPI003087CF0F|nr:DUF1579 family protein [Stieleria sp. HD01]